jgi:hypothetical protein
MPKFPGFWNLPPGLRKCCEGDPAQLPLIRRRRFDILRQQLPRSRSFEAARHVQQGASEACQTEAKSVTFIFGQSRWPV